MIMLLATFQCRIVRRRSDSGQTQRIDGLKSGRRTSPRSMMSMKTNSKLRVYQTRGEIHVSHHRISLKMGDSDSVKNKERRLTVRSKRNEIKHKKHRKGLLDEASGLDSMPLEYPSPEAPSLEAPSLEAPSLEVPSLEVPSLDSVGIPEIDGLSIPDPAEMLMKLAGMGPKGSKISNLMGGNLNVQLGKEGSPIYIDQSPSYIYHNPKSEYNQNGIRMPLADNSAIVTTPNSYESITTNFIRPRNLGSHRPLFISDQNGYSSPSRELGTVELNRFIPKEESGISIAPGGPLIQSSLQDVYPINPSFAKEGENQFKNSIDSSRLFERALILITSIKTEIEGVEDSMKRNNDKIDNLINRFFDIKFS